MERPYHLVTGSYLSFPWSMVVTHCVGWGWGSGVKPQDMSDAVRAGKGHFQPVSSLVDTLHHTEWGPVRTGVTPKCLPTNAAWQLPPWLHCRLSCCPATLALTHCLPRQLDSAHGLNLLTSCLKGRDRSSHHRFPAPSPTPSSQATCHLKIWAWTSRSPSPFLNTTGGQKQQSTQKYTRNVPG